MNHDDQTLPAPVGGAQSHSSPAPGSDGWRAFDDAREHVEKRLRMLKNPPPTSAALAESARDKECRRLMVSELEWVIEQFAAEARWHSHPNTD